MHAAKANYCLIYTENSDAAATASVRFFASLENARRAMKESFEASGRILGFPEGRADDEHKTSMTPDSIAVVMGMDSYYWRIEPISAEDA